MLIVWCLSLYESIPLSEFHIPLGFCPDVKHSVEYIFTIPKALLAVTLLLIKTHSCITLYL